MFKNFKVSLNKIFLKKKLFKEKKKLTKKIQKKLFPDFKIVLDKFILSSFLKRKWIKSNPKKAKDLFLFSFDEKQAKKEDTKDSSIEEKNTKIYDYLKANKKKKLTKSHIISKVKSLVHSSSSKASISNLSKLNLSDKKTIQKSIFSSSDKKKDFVYYDDEEKFSNSQKDFVLSKKPNLASQRDKRENNHLLSNEDLRKIKDIFLTIDDLLLVLPKNLLEKLVQSSFYGNYLEIVKKIKDL